MSAIFPASAAALVSWSHASLGSASTIATLAPPPPIKVSTVDTLAPPPPIMSLSGTHPSVAVVSWKSGPKSARSARSSNPPPFSRSVYTEPSITGRAEVGLRVAPMVRMFFAVAGCVTLRANRKHRNVELLTQPVEFRCEPQNTRP
eukprot:6081600-Pyramimonas_sp.AAC.1